MATTGPARRSGIEFLPWIAVAMFAAVGVAIGFKLTSSLSDGRMMAFLLELVFAILWLLTAAAYWVDLTQKRRKRQQRLERHRQRTRPQR